MSRRAPLIMSACLLACSEGAGSRGDVLDAVGDATPGDVAEEAAAEVCAEPPAENPLGWSAVGGGALCSALTVFVIDARGGPVGGAAVRVRLDDPALTTFEATADASGRVVFDASAWSEPITVEASDPTLGFQRVVGVRSAVISMRLGERERAVGFFRGRVLKREVLPAAAAGYQYFAQAWCIEPNPLAISAQNEQSAGPRANGVSWEAGAEGDVVYELAVYLDNCPGVRIVAGLFATEENRPPIGFTHLGIRVGPLPAEGETIDADVALTHALDESRTLTNLPTTPEGLMIVPLIVLPGGGMIYLDRARADGAKAELPMPKLDGDLAGARWGAYVETWSGAQVVQADGDATEVALPAAPQRARLIWGDQAYALAPPPGASLTALVFTTGAVGHARVLGGIFWLEPRDPVSVAFDGLPEVEGGPGAVVHESFFYPSYDPLVTRLEFLGLGSSAVSMGAVNSL